MRRGLTLSEVLVALAITAIAVFALISLQIASLRWKTKSTQRQEAAQLASSILNQKVSLLRTNFRQAVAVPRGPSSQPEYQFEVLESLEDPAPGTLKRVEVDVYWRDPQGEQRYRLVTRVYHG